MTDDEWADHLDEVAGHGKHALRAMTTRSERALFVDDLTAALKDFIRQGCPA